MNLTRLHYTSFMECPYFQNANNKEQNILKCITSKYGMMGFYLGRPHNQAYIIEGDKPKTGDLAMVTGHELLHSLFDRLYKTVADKLDNILDKTSSYIW